MKKILKIKRAEKIKIIITILPNYYKDDIVPFGILIEAETIDDLEKNTICRFCYNVQDGYKINYYDG